MQPKSYSMVPALIDNTYIFVFNYTGDANDFATDKMNFDILGEARFPIANSCAENGLGVTGSDLTISADTTKRTIKLSASTTMIAYQIEHPIVLYKGEPIPYSDFDGGTPPSTTDGLITLKSGTVTTYPSTTAGDYVVYYGGFLNGIFIGGSVGNVSLPLETTSFKVIGHVDPVYKVDTAGDPGASGNIQVAMSLTSHLFDTDTSPANSAGEELLSAIYGSEWTDGGGWDNRNALRRPTNPFGIILVQLSGNSLGDTQGKVWGRITCVYHCRLTQISEIQNLSNDATAPAALQVDFNSRFPDKTETTVVYCTG